jgi:16S rRNA (cytosine1402-N4)-methyltransferase
MASGPEEHATHDPVLLEEVLHWLRPHQGGVFVDCTVGLGGHSEAFLNSSPDASVIGLDADCEALAIARQRLARFGNRFRAVHANFENLTEVASTLGLSHVRGVAADLGVSSLQFDRAERGFSFVLDAPLDMRMDQAAGDTAADLINDEDEQTLANLIFEYGEERGARRIARAIARERDRGRISTTKQLADIVIRALNVRGRWRIHPATRTFQALRIAVNHELDAIAALIPSAIELLEPGGRLAMISFHSLEDRIVKRAFLRESGRCVCEFGEHRPIDRTVPCPHCGARRMVKVLTRKPIRPAEAELLRNPRSRSALLRVCERVETE